jgi:hypothetical protein
VATTTVRRGKRAPLTDEERDAKRAAERQLMQQAVEALIDSDGWQRWLMVRRHFHRYSLLISRRLRQRLEERITEYLKDHPQSTTGAIAKGLNASRETIGAGLSHLARANETPKDQAARQPWRNRSGTP